jgi:hypothetical protein
MAQTEDQEGIFAVVSRIFHDLGGLVTVITGTVDLLSTTDLTGEQRAGIERILATAHELDQYLTQASDEILSRLALTTGPVRVVKCLHGFHVNAAVLKSEVAHLRQRHLIAEGSNILIVAPGRLLAMLRRCFGQSFRLRVVTAPADVSFVLDDEPAQMIVLAPPPDEAAAWLRSVRSMLLRFSFTPLLVHLAAVEDDAGADRSLGAESALAPEPRQQPEHPSPETDRGDHKRDAEAQAIDEHAADGPPDR